MGRRTSMAAVGLASLALAGCLGGSDHQLVTVPPPEPQPTLEAATRTLTDRCLEADIEEGEATPAPVDAAVEELIRAFNLVEDPDEAEDEVRDARSLLEAGCASPETVQRFAVATDAGPGVERVGDSADCDAKGINADERQEGTCVVEGGPRVTVVDLGNTATTPELEVTLLDARVQEPLFREGETRAREGVASVMLTLDVRNVTDREELFDPASQVRLVLDDRTYSSEEGDTTELAPGDVVTPTVSFEVSAEAADELDTSGNVYVFGFNDAGLGFMEAQGTVAVLRTYQ